MVISNNVRKTGEISLSDGMVGHSTGNPKYDKHAHQKRKMKFIQQSWHGDFSGNTKPTAEQIELKKKRDLVAAVEEKKLHEKRMRGWHTRKARGDF